MAEREAKRTRTAVKHKKETNEATASAPPAKTEGAMPAPRAKAVAPRTPPPARARPVTAQRTRVSGAQTPAGSQTPPVDAAALRQAVAPGFEALTRELHELKRLVQPPVTQPDDASNDGDAALEGSVTSLRRVLSEALEQRMESVVKELVEVRRELTAADAAPAAERLERLLETLGASRFVAEPMDIIDPLIHVVVDERRSDGAPDGVVLETVRSGYRTARGAVVSRAAVVVNRRS